MAPDFTSVSVLISDPFGDSAGDGPTGVWTGGEVASTGMVLRIGVAARLSLIVTASIEAIPGSVIAIFRTSAALADSAIAPLACARVPLAASGTEAQREVFPPAVRRASAADSTAAASAVVDSTAAGSVAVAVGKVARELVARRHFGISWKAVFAVEETLVKGEKLCRAIQSKCFGSHR
jgi:hypothetical protein